VTRRGYDVPPLLAPLRGIVEAAELGPSGDGRGSLRLVLDCGHVRIVEVVHLSVAALLRGGARVGCPVCLEAGS
jgi:hypothetical protein